MMMMMMMVTWQRCRWWRKMFTVLFGCDLWRVCVMVGHQTYDR